MDFIMLWDSFGFCRVKQVFFVKMPNLVGLGISVGGFMLVSIYSPQHEIIIYQHLEMCMFKCFRNLAIITYFSIND